MAVVRGSIHGGKNCKIYPTALIDVDKIYLGDEVEIGPHVEIKGGDIHLGDRTRVGKHATINAGYLRTGHDSVIRAFSRLQGRKIVGSHRFYINFRAKIGGGSCWDPDAHLYADNWLHLGESAELNTARGITIGREVAVGPRSGIYTHGAWGSVWEGYVDKWGPVKIGDFAWIPTGVTISPGITIGSNCKIGRGALVNVDVPSGAHVFGRPISKYKDEWKLDQFPRKISEENKQKIIQKITKEAEGRLLSEKRIKHKFNVRRIDEDVYDVEGVIFNMDLPRRIEGTVNKKTKPLVKMFRDQARRNTLRFDYELGKDGKFIPYPILE